MTLIPGCDDRTIHLFLGSRDERLRERKFIQDIERTELGLPIESIPQVRERLKRQKEHLSKLAVPFDRRKAEKKRSEDTRDMRVLDRKREGPRELSKDEIGEEEEMIAKEIEKMRLSSLAALRAQKEQDELEGIVSGGGDGQQQNQDSTTFLTALAGSPSAASLTRSASASSSRGAGGRGGGGKKKLIVAHAEKYAGDILFRPGRDTTTMEPVDFWLYASHKVTQSTLGTAILQHPVVVGTSKDADDLKRLLEESKFASKIRHKIAHLLEQSKGRTRCGILFDLLSTRNIIVSGVPNIVGRFIYEHIHKTLTTDHTSLKFVFVGITDNSNSCAARDVFCQSKVLQGRSIVETKREFQAIDNTHIFAVPPPGGFEPLLGPAVSSSSSSSSSGGGGDKEKGTASSPLGMRPWHRAMKEKPPLEDTSPGLADPLQLKQIHKMLNQKHQPLSFSPSSSPSLSPRNNNNNNNNNQNAEDGKATTSGDGGEQNNTSFNNSSSSSSSSSSSMNKKKQEHQHQAASSKPSSAGTASAAASNPNYISRQEIISSFDPRDLKFLPNLGGEGKKSTKAKWEEQEMDNLRYVLRGPSVNLKSNAKRKYNTSNVQKHNSSMLGSAQERRAFIEKLISDPEIAARGNRSASISEAFTHPSHHPQTQQQQQNQKGGGGEKRAVGYKSEREKDAEEAAELERQLLIEEKLKKFNRPVSENIPFRYLSKQDQMNYADDNYMALFPEKQQDIKYLLKAEEREKLRESRARRAIHLNHARNVSSSSSSFSSHHYPGRTSSSTSPSRKRRENHNNSQSSNSNSTSNTRKRSNTPFVVKQVTHSRRKMEEEEAEEALLHDISSQHKAVGVVGGSGSSAAINLRNNSSNGGGGSYHNAFTPVPIVPERFRPKGFQVPVWEEIPNEDEE